MLTISHAIADDTCESKHRVEGVEAVYESRERASQATRIDDQEDRGVEHPGQPRGGPDLTRKVNPIKEAALSVDKDNTIRGEGQIATLGISSEQLRRRNPLNPKPASLQRRGEARGYGGLSNPRAGACDNELVDHRPTVTHACAMSRPSRSTAGFLVMGFILVAGIILVLESTRPLPGEQEGPRADPMSQLPKVVEGGWTLIRHDEPGRWRELRSPAGRSIVLQHPPGRIVSQTLLSDEVLLEICQRDRLRAITRTARDPRYSHVVSEAASFADHVADNTEHILGLRPDLVFVASYSTPETVAQLEKAGAPVLQLHHFDSIEAIRTNIRVIGFAVGRETEAAALIARMDRAINDAVGTRETTKRPRVVAWSEGSVPARGTIVDDVVRIAGGVNLPAAEGLEGWPRLSAEKVAQWSPDIILTDAAPGQEQTARDGLMRHPAIRVLVEQGKTRIVTVPSATFIVASHHVARFVELAARELMP